MRGVILIAIFLTGINHSLFAQLLYPEVMETIELKIQPTKPSCSIFPKNLFSVRRYLKNTRIENPRVRYAVQNITHEKCRDTELQDALRTLTRYTENDTIRRMTAYLKRYIKHTGQKENALKRIDERIYRDSILQYASIETDSNETFPDNDWKVFSSYIREDSNYIWLKKLSSDSILLNIGNASNQEMAFWINNGRRDAYRFWATNRLGDSIGTWIQVTPPGNTIKLYMDDDVYQAKNIDIKKYGHETLSNKLDKRYYNIQTKDPGQLWRRHWAHYSEVEAALGQGYLANWSSGGENSMSLLTNLRFFINYNKNKISWESFMHYRLGFLKSGDQNMRKNEEILELNTKVGQKAFKHWYYTTQLNIQTVILNSYEYPGDDEKILVANFMSPGYFNLSLGLDYKPNERFSLYLSPIAGKWTYVRDTSEIDVTRYGVEKGKKSKGDAGARVELRNKFSLFKIMDIRNELIMFSSYSNSQQRFTADWKVQIDFKINYFMRASVYTNVIYDENYSKKMQFKENLNLGVNFRF